MKQVSTKPKKSIKDYRLWLGIIFVIASVLLAQGLFAKAAIRQSAVLVIGSVPIGSALTENDVQLVEVLVPDSIEVISEIDQAIGKVVTRDLFSGDLLTKKSIVDRVRSDLRLISVPIKAGHLPSLQPGQLIDVWVTPSTDGMALPGPATLVISQATIEQVPEIVDPTLDTAVTLLIKVASVQPLVQAMRDGVIDLVALPDNKRS
ncbi:MAG: hypothetical protein RIR66_120 [Actinomycetota bacterium]